MELGSYFLFLQEQIKDIIIWQMIAPVPPSLDHAGCRRLYRRGALGASGERGHQREGSYNTDPVVRYSWVVSGSS